MNHIKYIGNQKYKTENYEKIVKKKKKKKDLFFPPLSVLQA